MASRTAHTPGALSHDFGGRGTSLPPHTTGVAVDRGQRLRAKPGTACHWPAKWRPIAAAILELPTTTRDEPQTVSGEIGGGRG